MSSSTPITKDPDDHLVGIPASFDSLKPAGSGKFKSCACCSVPSDRARRFPSVPRREEGQKPGQFLEFSSWLPKPFPRRRPIGANLAGCGLILTTGTITYRHARACPGHPRRVAASGLSGQRIGPNWMAGRENGPSGNGFVCPQIAPSVAHQRSGPPSGSGDLVDERRMSADEQNRPRPHAVGSIFICVHPAIGDPGFDAARGTRPSCSAIVSICG